MLETFFCSSLSLFSSIPNYYKKNKMSKKGNVENLIIGVKEGKHKRNEKKAKKLKKEQTRW